MTTYRSGDVTVHHADALDALARIPDSSVDSIVADPPYGLGFMGKAWDELPPGLPWAQECLRVLKPGGHLLAFGGTRTWHRLACAVEDAGFEMRDSIAWLYGSGFPKSFDVSKAIDKAAGAEREVVGEGAAFGVGSLRNRTRVEQGYRPTELNPAGGTAQITAPATDEARQWQGWGTALKPAFEPIVVARKPLAKGMTVAANVLTHGTGALNIDGCRIHAEDVAGPRKRHGGGIAGAGSSYELPDSKNDQPPGRWPANVVLDEDQAAALDQQSGSLTSGKMRAGTKRGTRQGAALGVMPEQTAANTIGDTGGASRFFYVAKAPKKERPVVDGVAHPTVKPLALMRWLVRLVTPPGGLVLDPFAGSGTTVEAALLEGFRVTAIERGGPKGTPEAKYLGMIEQRIRRARAYQS